MNKMYCNNCSNFLPQNAKFCGICGSQVIALKYCSCGDTIKPNTKFCVNCGKSFTNQEDNPTTTSNVEISICNCGASLKANMKFCGSCGMSVVNTQQTPQKADSQQPTEQKLEKPIEKVQPTKESETSESKKEQNNGNNICKCGAVVLTNAKFCNSCGANVSRTPEIKEENVKTNITPDSPQEIPEQEKRESENFKTTQSSEQKLENPIEKAQPIKENETSEKSVENVEPNKNQIESTKNETAPDLEEEIICSCGEIVLEDEKFCAYCGSSVVSKDDVNKKQRDTSSVSSSPTGESENTQKSNSLLCLCGATLKNSQKFCFNCGAKNSSKDTSVDYQANSNSNQYNQNQHFNNSGNLSHKKKKRKKIVLFVFIGLFMMFSIAALSVIFIFDFGLSDLVNSEKSKVELQYTHSQLEVFDFSFNVPDTWDVERFFYGADIQVTAPVPTVTGYSPNIRIVSSKLPDGKGLQSYWTENRDEVLEILHQVEMTDETTVTLDNGLKTQRAVFTFVNQNSIPLAMYVCAFTYDGRGYTLTGLVPTDHANDYAPIFIDSFNSLNFKRASEN